MACEKCGGEVEGYKCVKCGADLESAEGHDCGSEHVKPKCKACKDITVNCVCGQGEAKKSS